MADNLRWTDAFSQSLCKWAITSQREGVEPLDVIGCFTILAL